MQPPASSRTPNHTGVKEPKSSEGDFARFILYFPGVAILKAGEICHVTELGCLGCRGFNWGKMNRKRGKGRGETSLCGQEQQKRKERGGREGWREKEREREKGTEKERQRKKDGR